MLEFPVADHRAADPAVAASTATALDELEASIQFENQVDLGNQTPPGKPLPNAALEQPEADVDTNHDIDPDGSPDDLPKIDIAPGSLTQSNPADRLPQQGPQPAPPPDQTTLPVIEISAKEVLPFAGGALVAGLPTHNTVTTGAITGQATSPPPSQLQSPLTDGPEGPVVPAQNTKEPDMQLTRPTRLRTFPPGVISAATSAGGHPTSVDADTGEIVQIQRPSQTAATGQGAGQAPAQGGPQWQMTPAKHAQAVQQNQAIATLSAPPADEARITTSGRRGVLRTDTIPSALAGYAALPATKASAPSASPQTPLRDDPQLDPLALGTQDGPLRQSAAAAAPTLLHHSPKLTEAVAHQIAQIAQSQALHRREVVLQPEELGRVRLSLQTSDTAVNVSILVERPETLDLMRRYIGQLADEFRAMGYQDVSFEFTQQDQTQDGSQAPFTPKTAPADPIPEEDPTLQSPSNVAVQSTIDRRI